MKDIARELGVSVATVSRALKDSPRISKETRAAVKAFAEEHHFFPNVSAESFISPQSLVVSKKKPLLGATESW